MVDYDLEATIQARSHAAMSQQAICGVCERPIYQEPPFPGVPSIWKHRSSSHAISYSPEKHLASLTRVFAHAHRFEDLSDRVRVCVVQGCGAEMTAHVAHEEPEPVRSERERKHFESRMRGALKTKERRPLGTTPGF
jgi:hypothetical protein